MSMSLVPPPPQRVVHPYRRIAEHYRSEIRAGVLAPGAELPANRRLARTWHISTATARRVTDLLRGEGWIESRPGKPPIVVRGPVA